MGIGRRDFFRLASIALAGLGANPLKAITIDENLYVNSKLGFLFEKPDGWKFIKVQDFGEIFDNQILDDGWENFKDELKNELDEPICVITKYYSDDEKYKGIFSPTITIDVTPKSDFDFLGGFNMESNMKMSYLFVSSVLKDYTITNKYEPYIKDGNKFYEYDAKYLFEHVDSPEPIQTELKVLKTETKNFIYDFNMHHSNAKNENADAEFKNFIKSIKFI